jgi:amino acid transporter
MSLERVIGVRALAANTVNLTVGAGIFVLPALVAAQLGPAAVFAYLACAAAMGLVLLCFAEAGSRVFESGGACAYVEAAFGPYAGFLASTLLWLGYAVVSIAAVANALVGTLGAVFPTIEQPIPRGLFLFLLFAGVAWVNIRGVRQGARAVEIVTVMKLLPLVGLVLIGLFAIRPDNLSIETLPSAGDFGAATLLLFFAFGGSESAVTPSGEIRNPARTIPRGLLFGILGIVTLYLGLQAVAQGVLGADLPSASAAPLAATAERILGAPGAVILLAAAGVSMFGTVMGDMLTSPRALFASARDGVLPSRLASIHARFHTPNLAIAVYAGLAFAFAISGAFQPLAVLSTVAILLVYLSTVAATVELRRRDVRASDSVFRLPAGPLIPGLAAAVIVWLLAQATTTEWTAIGAMLGAASLFYLLRRR